MLCGFLGFFEKGLLFTFAIDLYCCNTDFQMVLIIFTDFE